MPTASFQHWSPTSVLPYVTGQVIGYIRDPSEFALNNWVQHIKTDNPQFMWAQIERDQAVRVVDPALFRWSPGDPRPAGNHNLTRHRWINDRVERFAVPWTLDEQLIDVNKQHGAADPESVEAKSCASQMMTIRVATIIEMMETVGNWNGNHGTVDELSGGAGFWDKASDDPASPFHNAIHRSLMKAVRNIVLMTNGKVRLKDLKLVMSPDDALLVGASPEMKNYLKFNGNTQRIIENTISEDPSTQWGMPKKLYGIDVVIEDAVRVTAVNDTDGTQATLDTERTFIKPSGTAYLTSRAGGLDAPYKTKSFSTVQCYFYKYEMAAESRYDSWNKRSEGSVVEQFKPILAAPEAGYLIEDTIS